MNIDWSKWEKELKEYFNIIRIKSLEEIKELQKDNTILCAHNNKRFTKWCNFYDFNSIFLTENGFNKIIKGKYKSCILYNKTPIGMKHHFQILHSAGIQVYFITKLPVKHII